MSQVEGPLLAERYRLQSELGRGGMGTVWQAFDEVLRRNVAVKEIKIPPEISEEERALVHERTLREARAAARLSHPSIITVHDVIDEDGHPWIVMELVRARSLQDVIDDAPLPPARAAEIGRQVLSALRTAHAAQVLHRDVKPSNVLLVDGAVDRVILTDFGIATVEGDTTLTKSGLVMGSPAYISPERLQGERAGPASDLWALGATLYAACEGEAPHRRPDVMSTFAAISMLDAPTPAAAGPLTPVIEGLLVRDPAERMSAEAATELLGQIARGPVGEPAAETAAAAVPARPANASMTAHDSPRAAVEEHRNAWPRSPRKRQAGGGRPKPGIAVGYVLPTVVAAIAAVAAVVAVLMAVPAEQADGRQAGRGNGARNAAATPVPDGFRVDRGPDFTIIVPEGWRRHEEGLSIKWIADSGAYIQVDRTQWSGDPYEHWEWFEKQVTSEDGGLVDYRRVALKAIFVNGIGAADLEFTWRNPELGPMHGIDRCLNVDGQAYAVFFATPARYWATYERHRRTMLDTFHGGQRDPG